MRLPVHRSVTELTDVLIADKLSELFQIQRPAARQRIFNATFTVMVSGFVDTKTKVFLTTSDSIDLVASTTRTGTECRTKKELYYLKTISSEGA